MIKRADSVRSLGHASIGIDAPTREKLKAAAAACGYSTLVEYLRVLADANILNKQGGFPGVVTTSKQDSGRLGALSQQAIEMSRHIPMSESRRMAVLSLANRHVKFNQLRHAELLFEKMETEFESYRRSVPLYDQVELDLSEA